MIENSPIDVPRFPNIEPFKGSFLKAASTDDEMVKISKTTNVSDKIDFIDNMLVLSLNFCLVT